MEVTNFSRHAQLFDPTQFNTPVTVLGAGATGSFLVLYLAKLGIKNITVYDFDIIEEHNVPNQVYGLQDLHDNKVDALASLVYKQTGIQIVAKNERYITQRLTGYVFNCVDSMETRKNVWLKSVKLKPSVKLYVEPRIGLDLARVYTIEPMKIAQHTPYEGTFYSDDEAEVSACGTSLSVVTSSATTAGLCARQLINHNNDQQIVNEILMDFISFETYNTTWE